MQTNEWHKGSRYWRFGMYVVLLAVALALYFNEPGPFLAVAPVFLTGAAGKSVVGEYNRPRYQQSPPPDAPFPEDSP